MTTPPPPVRIDLQERGNYTCRKNIPVAVERCELCGASRRPFYCKKCVKAWNLSPSVHSQRFVGDTGTDEENVEIMLLTPKEKYERLKKRDGEKIELVNSLKMTMIKKKENDRKLQHRSFLERNVKLVQKQLQENTEKLAKDKKKLRDLQSANEKTSHKLSLFQQKEKTITTQIKRAEAYYSQTNELLLEHYKEIFALRQYTLKDLRKYVFPIFLKIPQARKSLTEEETIANLLQEARLTSFVDGQWVCAENHGEQMVIVVPSLPTNVDFSFYQLCIREFKGHQNQSDAEVHKNPGCNVVAALQIATLYVKTLSAVLDVVLPYRLQLSDFTGDLDEAKFAQHLYKLNASILHLACSQHVDAQRVKEPLQTLQNLETLINWPNCGKWGSYDVSDETFKSLKVKSQLTCEASSDSDSECNDCREWEHVSPQPVTSTPEEYISGTSQASPEMSRSGLTNLYSSATGTVTSIFGRFWGTPSKK